MPGLVIYFYIINHLQNLVIKNTNKYVFSLTVPTCQVFESGLAEQCWLRVPREIAVKTLTWTGGLTRAGGSASKMAHSYGRIFGASTGQQASSSHPGLIYIGFKQKWLRPNDMVAGSPLPFSQNKQSKRMSTEAIFLWPSLKGHAPSLRHIVFIRSESEILASMQGIGNWVPSFQGSHIKKFCGHIFKSPWWPWQLNSSEPQFLVDKRKIIMVPISEGSWKN